MSAKTMQNKFCDAKMMEQEYKGRPSVTERKKRPLTEMVAPNPYSLNYTANAHNESQASLGKENQRQAKITKFYNSLERKLARRTARNDKKVLFAFKHQEEVYKKIINDQLEYAYKQKTWRPPGASDSDDSDSPKRRVGSTRSNLGSEAGSSAKGSTNGKVETKSIVVNDGLGNSTMSMCLSELNAIRQKLFERVGKSIPKKKKVKRPKKNAEDTQSIYSVATTT